VSKQQGKNEKGKPNLSENSKTSGISSTNKRLSTKRGEDERLKAKLKGSSQSRAQCATRGVPKGNKDSRETLNRFPR